MTVQVCYLAALPFLKDVETCTPEKLEGDIRLLLSDMKRSGTPSTFTPGQIMAIIDLVCKNPCNFGYETSQWSFSLLVTKIEKQGITDKISAKSVSRFLKMREPTPT